MKLLTLTAVSFLLIGLTMSGTAYSQVPQIEREALIALYNSTDGENWTSNTGWNGAAGTECDWYEITCASGHVTNITLSSDARGTLPEEFWDLTHLEEITFSHRAYLTWTLSPKIGNLVHPGMNVKHLYL